MLAVVQACALSLCLTAGAAAAHAQTADAPEPVQTPPSTPADRVTPDAPAPTPATVAPAAANASPKAMQLPATMTPKSSPLTDLTYEGLPANAVTVRSLVTKKQLNNALKVANIVLRREPRNVEVGMQRARLLYWLGRHDDAEKQATSVYKLDRYNTNALRLVGDIRLARKDIHGAIRAYREAILRGDPAISLKLRLIDLYIRINRPELAQALVRPGMELPDELAWQLARALHRFRAEVFFAGAAFQTANQTQWWQRAQASLAYTWSPEFTFMGGIYGERRGADRAGSQVFGQLFFSQGRLSGDFRLALSPVPSDFLPSLDGWAEGVYNFGKFGLGGWIRYASYPISPLLSLGPYAQIALGRLNVKVGYLFVVRGDPFAETQLDSTIFVRGRYQLDLKTALMAWFYYGQESVFAQRRRVLAPDESAVSVVLGAERWLGMRWGVRGLFTVVKYLREEGGTFAELLVALRARF